MNIHDFLSPNTVALAKTLGYGVFAVALAVILTLGVRLYQESRTAYNRFKHWR